MEGSQVRKEEVTRAVWLPFMFFRSTLMGQSELSFSNAITRAFDKIAQQGLNRVFVHVRPFGDALYRSDLFPSSFLVSGNEGDKLVFDPLEIMVKKARERGLGIEAWVNPFRVRSKYIQTGAISNLNPVNIFIKSGDAITYSDGLMYNPASQRAIDYVTKGVSELCTRYDIDGIHFDDYFYPNPERHFDASDYAAYKAPGGGLSQSAWRKANILMLLKQCWESVHAIDKRLVFGVSPKGFMECNLKEEYFDVPKALSKPGYLDYVCPQAYFAPNDEAYSFDDCMRIFDSLTKADIRLIAGLPAYKIGRPDPHAGAGEKDWLRGDHVLADMINIAKRYPSYAGYSLYDYSSVFSPAPELQERIRRERASISGC